MDLETLESLLQFPGLSLCFFLSSRTTGFTTSPSSLCTHWICAVVSAMCFLKNLNPDSRVNGSDDFTLGVTQQAYSYVFFDKETKRKPKEEAIYGQRQWPFLEGLNVSLCKRHFLQIPLWKITFDY